MLESVTTLSILEKFRAKHGDVYDYSLVNYINANSKVTITCKKHGEFTQLPRKHYSGQGCPKCSSDRTNDDRRLTTAEFINRSYTKHGNKYDYSLSVFVNSTTKIKIICPIHGIFEQLPHAHMSGMGCKLCFKKPEKFDYTGFYEKMVAVNGNLYEYDHLPIHSSTQLINIKCKRHGLFAMKAISHAKGRGCKKCKDEDKKYRLNVDTIKNRILASLTVGITLKNITDKVELVCDKHGLYYKTIKEHRNTKCPQCSLGKLSENNRMSFEEAKQQAIKLHKGIYEYDSIDYVNLRTKISIKCRDHGWFDQTMKNHLKGQGCPRCKISSGHLKILDILDNFGVNYKINDRNLIHPFELDVVIGDKLAIEFDGLYYHSYDSIESRNQKYRHYDKKTLCESKGIKLLRIREDELSKLEIVKSIIGNNLGLSKRLYARKCSLARLRYRDVRSFLENNHLAGSKNSTHNYALIHDNEIIQVMTFNKHTIYQYEIVRSATKCGYCVVGGLSKLFDYAKSDIGFNRCLTFADRRYTDGHGYEKLGFILNGITKPNYVYVDGNRCFSRMKFQKHKLKGLLDVFDPGLTEPENMFANGYRRLWDCGNYKFLYSG